jgi:hypothetical protein
VLIVQPLPLHLWVHPEECTLLKKKRNFPHILGSPSLYKPLNPCTVKKEKTIFLIYKEIQKGSGAKSYMRKGFLIKEEVRKYFVR